MKNSSIVCRRIKAALWTFLGLSLMPAIAMAQQASAVGQWQDGPTLPNVPIHTHLLPEGKLMMWQSAEEPLVWDPATNVFTSRSMSGFNVFCTGHSFLPDGRLFVAGGHIQNNVGLPEASIYDSTDNTWSRQPQMNAGRWYPTNTVMPNGDVLVVSGSIDNTQGSNPLPQVWEAVTGSWRDLTSAQLSLPLYPYMFLAPNGKVFLAGPSQMTRYLDTSGTGSWSNVGNRTTASRDYGSSIMYEPGKVFIAGGGSQPPTNTAEVIDLNASQPAWRAVAPMANARRQMYATMLPDGKVLVTGGTSGRGFNNPDGAVFAAEMWDPETEAWTTLASARIKRLYHAVAILLPDARVLTTGGDDILETEIFSPPYLFAGARPVISSAPTTVARDQAFFLGTADAADITQVSWVRLGSTTHTVTMSQAFARSKFTRVAGGLNVTVPSSETAAPGGHYMLFILKNGVPSVARIIRIADGINAPAISSLSPSSAAAGGGQFTLTVNGSNFASGATVRWNGSNRTTAFVSPTQLRATIAAADIAAAGMASITVTTSDGLVSNAIAFTIGGANPAPTLNTINPTAASAGGPAFTLTVNGTSFVSSSVIRWNG
ncbi:MAG: galactose oxidase-like domain-containing protein, partial [Burkholderiales bacterium]